MDIKNRGKHTFMNSIEVSLRDRFRGSIISNGHVCNRDSAETKSRRPGDRCPHDSFCERLHFGFPIFTENRAGDDFHASTKMNY